MGFIAMLIGFIFIFFNFNFEDINVLPDFVGYILIYLGAITLKSYFDNENFSQVRKSSLLLIFLSGLDLLIKYVDGLSVLTNIQTVQGRVFSFILHFVMLLLLTYCVVHICRGIEKEAVKRQKIEFSEKTNRTMIVFSVYQGILLLVLVIGTLVGKELQYTGGGALFILVLMLVVMIYVYYHLFSLLRNAERVFSEW